MNRNNQGPDRVILFEIGVIVALLLVHWFVNLEYKMDTPKVLATEPLFIDSPFIYYPKVEQPEEVQEEQQIAALIPFDLSSVIKVVDLFKKEKPVLNTAKLPSGPIGLLPINTRGDQSYKIDSFVESMPQFPGGRSALLKFVQENYNFPQAMFDRDENVKLMIRFVVNEDGQVSDYEVVSCTLKGIGVEQEALNLFDKMPKWIAGKQGGNTVKVRMQIPLNLQLY